MLCFPLANTCSSHREVKDEMRHWLCIQIRDCCNWTLPVLFVISEIGKDLVLCLVSRFIVFYFTVRINQDFILKLIKISWQTDHILLTIFSSSLKGRIVQPPKTGLKCTSAAAPALQQTVACQSCPLIWIWSISVGQRSLSYELTKIRTYNLWTCDVIFLGPAFPLP